MKYTTLIILAICFIGCDSPEIKLLKSERDRCMDTIMMCREKIKEFEKSDRPDIAALYLAYEIKYLKRYNDFQLMIKNKK